MKKRWAPALVALVLWVVLSMPALAQEVDLAPQLEAVGFGKLGDLIPEEAKESLEQGGLGQVLEGEIALSPSQVLQSVENAVKGQLKVPLGALAMVGAVVVLAAFLDGMHTAAADGGSVASLYSVTASLVVCASVAAPVIGCITATAKAIQDCAGFVTGFIPVFAGVLTVGGQAVTATTYHLFLFSLCQVVSRVSATILVPLLGVYLALCLTAAAVPSLNLGPLSATVKTAAGWLLGLLMTVFVAFLTVQTVVASSGDTVATKTTKFLIGSFVPVVGGALADAFMAAQGCLQLLKATVGAYGMVVALFIFLPVLTKVLLWYLVMQVSGGLAALFGLSQVSGLLKAFSTTLGFLMALILSFALIVTISTTLILLVGQGVAG